MKAETLKRYSDNIWKIFLIYGLAALAMMFTTIIIFYYQHFNMSFFMISLIVGTGLLTTILMEVPTGAFADLYGKKLSICLGLFGILFGLITLAVASTFPLFIIGSVFWGLGQAFISGAWEALLYDSLKKTKQEKKYLKIISMQQTVILTGFLISSLLGPYLFTLDIRYPFYVGILFSIILVAISFTLYEPKISRSGFSLAKHLIQMKIGFNYIVKNMKLKWLISFGILGFVVNKVFGELIYAPYIIEKGFSITQYGLINFTSLFIQIPLITFAHKIEDKLKEKKGLPLIFSAVIVSMLLMYLTKGYSFVVFYSLFGSFLMMQMLFMDSYFNHQLNKKIRATVISIFSMVASLCGTIFLVIFGVISDRIKLNQIILFLAIIALLTGTLLFLVKKSMKIV